MSCPIMISQYQFLHLLAVEWNEGSRNWSFFTVFMSKGWLEVRFPGQWWLLYVAADRPNAWVQTRSIVFKKVQALVGGGPSQWVRPCRRQIQLLTGALPCFAQMPPTLLLLCRHVPWTTNIFAKLRDIQGMSRKRTTCVYVYFQFGSGNG